MKLHRYLFAAAIAAASLSSPVHAQSAATVSGAGAPIATQATVGVRRSAYTPTPAPQPAPFRADTKQNRALMIVGGAALLTGAVVGGSAGGLIMLGGAVVGLWGLFQYLQ
jgi:hypothetical protein